jgi:threonine dehydratase/serine racemase
MPTYAVTIDDIRAAAGRIAGKAHRTPVATCAAIDRLAGCAVFFKCEHLQKVGAFKFRGACNAVALFADDAAQKGVVTHSSGNHAQALALAARLRGIPAHIVMPRGSAAVKKAAVEGYGARVVECEPTLEARECTASRVQEETGATFIHPYDNPHIIAGQGTAALELLDQVPHLDALVVPVGGGGLLSGSCIATCAISPSTRIFAAEPQGADDAARSFAAGNLIPQTNPQTIADGLRTSLGELTWPIIRDHIEAVVTVGEDEIVAAMRIAWERAKLMIEPSAAVALAAVLSASFKARAGIHRVGVLLSGGNVDVTALPF